MRTHSALLVLLPLVCLAADDPVEIVRKSAAADQRTLEQAKDYTFREATVERELDSSGKVKSSESRTYDVLMLYGRPFRKLIAKEGRPLSPGEQSKEDARLQKEIDKRRKESDQERAKREREAEKERSEMRGVAAEIPNAHNLTLLREEMIGDRATWVIKAEPKPNYTPKNPKAKFITKMRGTLWIDKSDYHWVQLEAEPVETISFGLVLARVSPGTKIEISQSLVNGEVWVPTQIRIRLNARLGLLKTFRKELEVAYSDYRKFQTDSRVVSVSDHPAP